MMTNRLLGLLLGLIAISIHAQQLKIKSIKLLSNDLTAVSPPVLTASDDTCALIKIKGDGVAGLQFTDASQYIEKRYDNESSTFFVYVHKTPQLAFKHRDYLPGVIDIRGAGFGKPKGGKTYLVQLETPKKTLGQSIIALRVEPSNAIVTFNSLTAPISVDGIYEFPIDAGSFEYLIQADNYYPMNGTVTVGDSETKTLSLQLQPIMHEVNIKCNAAEARVIIDNIEYGKAGRLMLPQGRHSLRIFAPNYLEIEGEIDIESTTKMLTYHLEKNQNKVRAVPVTIYSNSKRLYKNQRLIPEWHNGATIKFLPGKYMLSDDDGNEKIIDVRVDTPQTIKF